MAVTNNKKIRVAKNHYKIQFSTDFFKHITGQNYDKEFDKTLNSLLKYYGQNVYKKITAESTL
jgi:hypothetical protein